MTAAPKPADFRLCSVQLPQRALTAEEMHGFRIACGMFATWARQLMVESAKIERPLGPDDQPDPAPLSALGRQMIFMAEALDLTIGQHGK